MYYYIVKLYRMIKMNYTFVGDYFDDATVGSSIIIIYESLITINHHRLIDKNVRLLYIYVIYSYSEIT